MESHAVTGMLYLACAGGAMLPGMAIAYRIATDERFAWGAMLVIVILGSLALIYMIHKQRERVLHLKKEDELHMRFLGQAAESQMRVALATEGGHRLGGGQSGGWEAEALEMFRRGRERLSGEQVIEAQAREAS